MKLDKGDCPENLPVMFCPSKQRSFERFMSLDLVVMVVEARYKIMWQYQCSFVAVISVVLAVRGFVLMQR